MPLSLRKPASALLLTLLITSVSGAVLLAATRTLLNSSRSLSAADSDATAYKVAEAGLEDGLLRYNASCGGVSCGLTAGEYGLNAFADATNPQSIIPYSLKPLRRGFKVDSSCQSWGQDDAVSASAYDPQCPYYDLSVHTSVSLPDTAPNPLTFSYTQAELPAGQAVRLRLVRYVGNTPFSLHAIGADVSWTTMSGQTQVSSGTVLAGSFGNVPLGYTDTHLVLRASAGLLSLEVTPGIAPLAIEKGFTSIESTGYDGGVRRHLIATVKRDGTFSVAESTQLFDANGLLK